MKATKLPVKTRAEALQFIAQRLKRPGMYVLQLAHDSGCPAITSQRDADCAPPCSPDFYLVEPFSKARAA